MGNQLFTFVSHHWPLCLAFIGVLMLMIVNERFVQKQGPKHLSPNAVVDAMNHGHAALIDIRHTEPFRQSHIIDAKNMPHATESQFEKYKNKPFILICERGLQSSQLAVKLRKQGFTQTMVLAGGIDAWKAANLPLIKGKKESAKALKHKK